MDTLHPMYDTIFRAVASSLLCHKQQIKYNHYIKNCVRTCLLVPPLTSTSTAKEVK